MSKIVLKNENFGLSASWSSMGYRTCLVDSCHPVISGNHLPNFPHTHKLSEPFFACTFINSVTILTVILDQFSHTNYQHNE